MDHTPISAAIVSAVSRHLVVRDLAVSIRYYTCVLGFALTRDGNGDYVQPTPVLTYGPAQLLLHTDTAAVDSTGPLRPPGMAMLFFEVSGLDVFWERFAGSGAQPTPPEKINWIKYRMFEVRDPDGHRLWFGESYHEVGMNSDSVPGQPASSGDPVRYDLHTSGHTASSNRPAPPDMHTPPGKGQLRQIMPSLPCALVPEAVKYYRDVLGFTVNYQQHDLGVMDRDEVRLLLISRRHYTASTAECCIYIENADGLHAELTAKGALVQGVPISHPWGLRSFDVLDPDGNCISFAQTFE